MMAIAVDRYITVHRGRGPIFCCTKPLLAVVAVWLAANFLGEAVHEINLPTLQ